AASTETRKLATATGWPTYSSNVRGRSARSNVASSATAARLEMPAAALGSSVTRALRGSQARPRASQPRSAVDLVEQLLRRRDGGASPERIGDHLGRFARAVAELLHEHVPDQLPQALVGGGTGGFGHRRRFDRALPYKGELRHLVL